MKTQAFRLLAFGDVVGEPSTAFMHRVLPRLRKELAVDFCIANGENSARRGGIDPESAQMLFAAGVDLITTGNHVFRQRTVYDYLDGAQSLLRPCNYPGSCPGRGSVIVKVSGLRVLVINVMGTLFMESLANPFLSVERILEEEAGRYDLAVCDIHAEATSEKRAFGLHFDSRIHVIFGTHTHVATADLSILKGGTGYVTDLGMCGPRDSVLGMKKEGAIARVMTHMPSYYEISPEPIELHGALFTVDPTLGRVTKVEPITVCE